MEALLDAALANPWATLDRLLDGPLHPGGEAATATLLDRAGVDADTRLLDVGCGAGAALDLARERGATAWGVDRDPQSACGAGEGEAGGTVGGDGGRGGVLCGDATALPVRDGRVDVVLAECVLCLTEFPAALAEARRVLAEGGRLALSDVVVADEAPAVPDAIARACCLTGARSREALTASVERAGFEVGSVRDHREDLLAMRDRVTDRVDYRGLLGAMGARGRDLRAGIEDLEAAVEDGRVGYVSLVARA